LNQRLDITFGLALLAAGCITPGCHRPLRELPPTRAEYPAYRSANESSPSPAPASPAASVPANLDATAIHELFAANHPELVAARARIDEAQAATTTASAWPNPEIGGRLMFDTAGGAIRGEGAFLFPLPLGGRIGEAEAVAALNLERARTEVAALELEVRVEADRRLARLAHARARLALLQELAERSARYATLARERRAASVADPLDVALVLADAARDRRAVAREGAAVTAAEEEIRMLAGLPPEAAILRVETPARRSIALDREQLIREAEQHCPALLLARLKVASADAEAQLAAAERVPDLHLGPAVAGEDGGVAVGLQAGIPLPLINSGRGPYDEALARRRAALEEYRAEARRTAAEVVTLLARLAAADEEIDALLGESIAAAEQAFALARARYEAGKLDVLRLLSAHRAFADLKLEHLDLLLARQEVVLDLELGVGLEFEPREGKS